MSDELILRDYLFRFLRSPDYITDVNYYLPKYLAKDPHFAETQRVLSWEHERYRLKIIDFAKQFHPQTATWGLGVWEEELGLPTDLTVDMELRRAKVMAKLLGASPMTVANTNKLVNLFTDDGRAYVNELPSEGTIGIIIPSNQVYMDDLRNALDEMLPAHLTYFFQRIIIIGGEDDEEADDLSNVNDNGKNDFFLHADFPIVEDVPYGKWYHAPKYDGSVYAGSINAHNNSLRYDGMHLYKGLGDDATKYGEFCKWWFKAIGNTFFNKEYRHNGIIRYDGLKPLEIEYDDGMDELKTIEVSSVIEESIANPYKYDKSITYDGSVIADNHEVPTDVGGSISISRVRRFNGKLRYDGDDINRYNGALKADGNFAFDGSGAKALIETTTDKINGLTTYTRSLKETPLSFFNPNFSDYVPVTTEKHVFEFSTGAVEDTVSSVNDEDSTLNISKVIRYDGVKRYDGGDINRFNGEIKADGKFTFIGGGNQAKIEVIAINLDENSSVLRTKKNMAPNYIENADFVSIVRDENQLMIQSNFEEFAEPKDNGGEMIIRRRARFDGALRYHGYFEYTAGTDKRYNGSLSYDGNCRIKADHFTKYNGVERYGGRKNQNFVEYISDIDGNVKIIDTNCLEKIPIATHDKLGFVIAGDNLNIDDSGKISLADNLKPQPLIEVDTGVLKTMFKNRSV